MSTVLWDDAKTSKCEIRPLKIGRRFSDCLLSDGKAGFRGFLPVFRMV
ncbi:prephenate dehydratase [Neisseria meningitidis]|uniref:Prephenate dehydratase n=1 Tax=Neisseria lactamica TaxID=486 RepID=A0AAU8VEV4_NEILA|nr:prephenate dehydratase [Neisseria lactamica]RQL21952.1 prephenate dehydratase [Neisseria meningitidis]